MDGTSLLLLNITLIHLSGVLLYSHQANMPAAIAPGSVQTELNYAKPVPGDVWVTDFTKPGAEEHFEEFERGRVAYPTTVVNLRSRRHDFSLAESGFEYVDDEMIALEDADSEAKIAEILLPATEALVKRVSVLPACEHEE